MLSKPLYIFTINRIRKADSLLKIRGRCVTLNELLGINKAESAKQGFGAFFIVGDENCAAVHSEPNIQEERLFFSILPGDKAEINELYLRWNPSNFVEKALKFTGTVLGI